MNNLVLSVQATLLIAFSLLTNVSAQESKPIRAGIIGLDTSHAIAFTTALNKGPKNPADKEKLAGVVVVAAYPQGSRDIPSSTERVPGYTEKVKEMGVEIVDSIEALLAKVDVVFLERVLGAPNIENIGHYQMEQFDGCNERCGMIAAVEFCCHQFHIIIARSRLPVKRGCQVYGSGRSAFNLGIVQDSISGGGCVKLFP